MEMSPVAICEPTPVIAKLITLACLLWPLIAASFLSRRTKSAGPVVAALVPLALTVSGMLLGIYRALVGMALSGGGRAAVSAGLAEALAFPGIGACFSLLVVIVAAIRRHRPFVDRLTVAVFALLIAETIGALFIAANIGNGRWQFYACLTGAGIAAIAAIVAAVWTFRTGRGRTTSEPIPYGITICVIASVILGVFVRQEILHYMQIAMGRQ